MLSYQYASAAAEGLLLRVNQSAGHSRKPGECKPAPGEPRHSGRRRLRRQLALAAARIERGDDYQRSLAELAELAASFQAELNPTQKDRWLALEEAMLEHVARLNRSYFYAGAAWGKRLGRSRRTGGHAAEPGVHRRRKLDPEVRDHEAVDREGLDREVIVGLAAVVAKLARR